MEENPQEISTYNQYTPNEKNLRNEAIKEKAIILYQKIKYILWLIWPTVERVINLVLYKTYNFIKSFIKIVIDEVRHGG